MLKSRVVSKALMQTDGNQLPKSSTLLFYGNILKRCTCVSTIILVHTLVTVKTECEQKNYLCVSVIVHLVYRLLCVWRKDLIMEIPMLCLSASVWQYSLIMTPDTASSRAAMRAEVPTDTTTPTEESVGGGGGGGTSDKGKQQCCTVVIFPRGVLTFTSQLWSPT